MIVENNEYFHGLYQTMLKGPEYKYVHAYDGYAYGDSYNSVVIASN